MKNLSLLVLICLLISACGSIPINVLPQDTLNANNYQDVAQGVSPRDVDTFPKYPDGIQGVYRHIQQNVSYPERAMRKDVEGTVMVNLAISKEGYVEEVTIAKSISEDLDAEALRVIKKLDRWYPAFKNKKPVTTSISIPIVFRLVR